ncbi:MAG TPA: hypothetical protein PLO69_11140 [Gammaproteobacteria bacterium]|nr:hypothetical protein [Gammaproteobacteria bacterium]
MAWQPQDQEAPEETAARVALAVARDLGPLMDILAACTRRGSYERALLTRSAATLNPHEQFTVRCLAWHYRDRLPRWRRPAQNPADPIVHESEMIRG